MVARHLLLANGPIIHPNALVRQAKAEGATGDRSLLQGARGGLKWRIASPLGIPSYVPHLALHPGDPAARRLSNIFMTLAWYGHLNFKTAPLATVVMVSWAIAFVEYWLAGPGQPHRPRGLFGRPLKAMQEVITLRSSRFSSVVYLKEALTWNHLAGFALIAAGAALVFRG